MSARAELLMHGDVSMFSGSTTLYREMLKSCSKERGSKIPANWSSNKCRAELEAKGWLTSEAVDGGWSIRWKITDAGRAALVTSHHYPPQENSHVIQAIPPQTNR